jgi:hypothetical protein
MNRSRSRSRKRCCSSGSLCKGQRNSSSIWIGSPKTNRLNWSCEGSQYRQNRKKRSGDILESTEVKRGGQPASESHKGMNPNPMNCVCHRIYNYDDARRDRFSKWPAGGTELDSGTEISLCLASREQADPEPRANDGNREINCVLETDVGSRDEPSSTFVIDGR